MNLLVVNFKVYTESLGNRGLELVKKIEGVSNEIVIVPQTPDLRWIKQNTSLPIYAQHIDPVTPGSKTGHILPDAAKEIGCVGALINHSERPLTLDVIEKTIVSCRNAGLKSMVCVPDIEMLKKVAALNPDMIAIEPPELIGGDVSVCTANPEIIEQAVKASPNIPVLCGAGVNSGADAKKAVELGAKGILIASAIVKNPQPEGLIRELYENLKGD